jgi:hypothetical protein
VFSNHTYSVARNLDSSQRPSRENNDVSTMICLLMLIAKYLWTHTHTRLLALIFFNDEQKWWQHKLRNCEQHKYHYSVCGLLVKLTMKIKIFLSLSSIWCCWFFSFLKLLGCIIWALLNSCSHETIVASCWRQNNVKKCVIYHFVNVFDFVRIYLW